jgi:hypothetical protein
VQADRVADGIPLCRDPHGPANRVPGLRAPSLYRAAAECPEVPLIVSGAGDDAVDLYASGVSHEVGRACDRVPCAWRPVAASPPMSTRPAPRLTESGSEINARQSRTTPGACGPYGSAYRRALKVERAAGLDRDRPALTRTRAEPDRLAGSPEPLQKRDASSVRAQARWRRASGSRFTATLSRT